MNLKILSVVEARSGLFKAKAICDAIQSINRVSRHIQIRHLIVHTGQFSDTRGFDLRFNDLELPHPDSFLGVAASANPFEKTAAIAERLGNILIRERPAVVLLAGDGDSLLDCALVTRRIRFRSAGEGQSLFPALAHIEAGRRSFDRRVLQEVNRIVIDMLSDYLFTSDESAAGILAGEGMSGEKIHFVGSIAVDTLLRHRERVADSSILSDLQLVDGSMIRPFALLALQQLSDDSGPSRLSQLQSVFSAIARRMPVVFPANAAILKFIHEGDLGDYFIDHCLDGPEASDERARIRLVPPLGYFDFVRLAGSAKVVLTDSRSVQEESRVLGVPCIALSGYLSGRVSREAEAQPPVGVDPKRILDAFDQATRGGARLELPSGWDGQAARRLVDVLVNDCASRGSRQWRLEETSRSSLSFAGM